MALVDDLTAEVNTPMYSATPNWRQYLLDHIDVIRSKSPIYYPDPTVMARYRYDVRWYITDNGRPAVYDWIFLLVNDLPTEMDFCKSRNYYMPETSYLIELYQQYQAVTKNN